MNMKLIRISTIITILLLLAGGRMIAQTPQVVSGTVTEFFDGASDILPGVNVSVVNSQNRTLGGVLVNANGQYNLVIPEGEKDLELVFSYIGMRSQRVKYTGQKIVNIEMQSDENLMSEVVVVGERRNDMGISSRDLGWSTQKINMDDILLSSPVVSMEEALQGQMGGVDITIAGDPGARSAIRIRGISTLNGSSDPLIVIDGVPTSTDTEDFDFSTANEEDLGSLLNIAPTDIESIEVLKDAASTAVWGTKGANGVLLITTKKGTMGKTRFSFASKFTTKIEPKTIPMLNGKEYTAMVQDAIWNSANYVGVNRAQNYLRLLFDTPEIGYDQDWKYFNEFNQDVDWLSLVSKDANTFDNSISMSGGGEKATYRFSLSLLNDDGTTIGTSLMRLTTKAVVNYQFSNKLRFGADFSYIETNRDASWTTSVRGEAFAKMPNKSPFVIDPLTGRMTDDYFTYQTSDWEGVFKTNTSGSNTSNFNPVAMAHEASNKEITRERKMTIRADYKILEGFTYNGYVSMSMRSGKTNKFLPQEATGVPWISRYANMSTENYSESFGVTTENKLNYTKNWNKTHTLVANAIFRTGQSMGSSYASTTSGMASSDVADPIKGVNIQSMGSGESEGRNISALSVLGYTLYNRYSVQGTVNMESNSAMGRNKRIGYFPSVAASWNIQNEPFLKGANEQWLDQAKLRFSYGHSGRAPKGTALYLGALTAGDNYMDMPTIAPIRMQLDKLKWEVSEEYNFGADFAVLDNRFRLVFDYYQKYASDLLQKGVGIPTTTGFTKIEYFNSGKMENRGWEVRSDFVLFNNKDWRISGNMNLSRNENKITEFPVNMNEESGVAEGDANMKNGDYAFRVMEGNPFGSFYGYRYKGVYADKNATYARDPEGNVMNDVNGNPIVMKNGLYACYPGDAMYEDINHDGVINKYDIVYLGNFMPSLTGGASLTAKYKQVSLSANFHARFGQSVVNRARMNNESMYGKNNQSTAVLRRWRNEGDITDIPRALYNEGLNYLGSDRFVEDATFIRLKTLSLTYAFPRSLCTKMGIQSLSVFATGYNLITWTDYTGQDPEVNIPNSPSKLAEDGATTPVAKRFSIGLNLNF